MTWLYRFLRTLLGFLFHYLFSFKVYGKENIPEKVSFLVVSNHCSNLDPIILGISVKNRDLHFLAKRELFSIPIFGSLLRMVNAFPIKRGAPDRAALKKASKILKEGQILALFPEGTRSKDGSLGAAKPGVAMIAVKANCEYYLPLYIEGSWDTFKKRRFLIWPGKIQVYIGKLRELPPPAEAEKAKDYYQRVSDEMRKAIQLVGAKKN